MASPEPLGSSRVGGSLYLRLRLLRSCCSSNPDDLHKVPSITITARASLRIDCSYLQEYAASSLRHRAGTSHHEEVTSRFSRRFLSAWKPNFETASRSTSAPD
ncbi:hypothetical protein CgunFtcFv8_015908 [Champsocephalus gunnari]|uniref:Uncharacterized protein n=1 Tax=Champsocephalus gunnari TaxID=52237 RepID=A0AAN8C7A4_CHAGU|nr:hypothetical protein CgunFtcFv8_015908 [Champsocephalus gunnari]